MKTLLSDVALARYMFLLSIPVLEVTPDSSDYEGEHRACAAPLHANTRVQPRSAPGFLDRDDA